MFELELSWNCLNCDAEMHDDLSFASLYIINGRGNYAKRYCRNCHTAHYINTTTKDLIVDSTAIKVEANTY